MACRLGAVLAEAACGPLVETCFGFLVLPVDFVRALDLVAVLELGLAWGFGLWVAAGTEKVVSARVKKRRKRIDFRACALLCGGCDGAVMSLTDLRKSAIFCEPFRFGRAGPCVKETFALKQEKTCMRRWCSTSILQR